MMEQKIQLFLAIAIFYAEFLFACSSFLRARFFEHVDY